MDKEKEVAQVAEEFRGDKLARRDAIKALLSLGLRASAAYALLGVIKPGETAADMPSVNAQEASVGRKAKCLPTNEG